MHWYGYLLLGIGIPYAGWIGVSVVGLQVAIADVKRRQTERDDQCAGHMLTATRIGDRIADMGKAIARIEGKLDQGDLSQVIKSLRVLRGEGKL